MLVLPEYASTFTPKLADLAANAERRDGHFMQAMADLAREHELALVFGFVEALPETTLVANTLFALDATGSELASYQKVHLYDAFGAHESEHILAGSAEQRPVFTHRGLRFGLQTCYDLRFAETSRWLIDDGAEVLLVPAEWVAGPNKVHHFRTLLTARAIENLSYVLAADHPEPIGVGHSMAIDPLGATLVELDGDEGFAVAELSAATLSDARAQNPALSLRRFSVQPR